MNDPEKSKSSLSLLLKSSIQKHSKKVITKVATITVPPKPLCFDVVVPNKEVPWPEVPPNNPPLLVPPNPEDWLPFLPAA